MSHVGAASIEYIARHCASGPSFLRQSVASCAKKPTIGSRRSMSAIHVLPVRASLSTTTGTASSFASLAARVSGLAAAATSRSASARARMGSSVRAGKRKLPARAAKEKRVLVTHCH